MSHPSDLAFCVSQQALVYTASLLVPAPDRDDWRREWLAELWHVRRSYAGIDETFTFQAEREITSFCLGAFPDAFCLRTQPLPQDPSSAHVPPVHVHGSAAQMLLWLAAVAAICCLISTMLPGVHAEREALRYQIGSNVLLLGNADTSGRYPSIPTALYREWKTTRQRFFHDLAFYRVSRETAQTGRSSKSWNIAHSTGNLFPILGLPIDFADPEADQNAPSVILSRKTWIREFGGDPYINQRVIRINHDKFRIAGVAPAGSWELPGAPDAWLLESDAALSSEHYGFVIARLSKRGAEEWQGPGSAIAARDRQDNAMDLFGLPLTVPVEGPGTIFSFALFLALLALPAVTSVSLSESQISAHRPSRKQQALRILFLIAKFNLIGAIAYYASLDIAYSYTPEYSSFAECLQLLVCFAICLMGFRWAVADQRQRCPMCLRRVTNPATVGLASRTFLGWNGTEMICMGGHALLHVPSLPTSWFDGQRWLYLDSSWEFLFADSSVSSTY